MNNDVVDKIRRAVGKTAKKAAEVSGNALDYTKIKLKLYEINDELYSKYAQIGRCVYEECDDSDLDALCSQITELREQESELKIKLGSYQSKKTCENCGQKADVSAEYCPSCGHKF